jgi:hypothetical protein
MQLNDSFRLSAFWIVFLSSTLCVLTSCVTRGFSEGVAGDASAQRVATGDARASAACDPSSVFVEKICNWGAFPTPQELEKKLEKGSSFVDYRPVKVAQADSTAPRDLSVSEVGLNLPGQVIFDAMKAIYLKYITEYFFQGENYNYKLYSTRFGSYNGFVGYHNMLSDCLKTVYTNSHYSDLAMNYYCLLNEARMCFTYGMSGGREIHGANSRNAILQYCNTVSDTSDTTYKDKKSNRYAAFGAPEFQKFVTNGTFQSGGKIYRQLDVFRYIMLSRTSAFPGKQEQRLINEFWAWSGKYAKEAKSKKGTLDIPSRANQVPLDYWKESPSHCLFRADRTFDSPGESCSALKVRTQELTNLGL